MRILAIDPGSMLGWATDSSGRLEWGTENFQIKSGESSGNRWMRFGKWLHYAAGRHMTKSEVEAWARGFAPPLPNAVDLIVYEVAHFMPNARLAAEIAGAFKSRLEEFCEDRKLALQPVPVQTLKAFALPKIARKKGDPKMDRSKAAMIMAAGDRMAREYPNDRRLKVRVTQRASDLGPDIAEWQLTEHEADALHLYWWAMENCANVARIAGDAHP